MPDKLESLATEINSAFRAVDSARVEAGRLLLKAQAAHAELLEKPCDPLIIASLKPCDPLIIASLLTFKGWCLRYIKRSYRDIMRCMALARAENPRAAVEAERSTARQGMRKTRAKQMTNVSHPRAAAAAAPHLRVVSSDTELRNDEGFTAEDDRIWDALDAAAKAAGDDEGPWRASAPGVAPFYTLTQEAVYRKLYDAYLKIPDNSDKPRYKDFASCDTLFFDYWGDHWFIGDLTTFELDEREEAYKALIAEPEKPEIIQPKNQPINPVPPTEQKTTGEKWKASSIVGDGIDPVVFEGDSQSMVYEDACEYMWDIWFGGGDTPDLPELKRFMALMAEFCPDIVWKFEQVKPSGADQVKAKVAEILAKKSN